jgi:hypothetical protein
MSPTNSIVADAHRRLERLCHDVCRTDRAGEGAASGGSHQGPSGPPSASPTGSCRSQLETACQTIGPRRSTGLTSRPGGTRSTRSPATILSEDPTTKIPAGKRRHEQVRSMEGGAGGRPGFVARMDQGDEGNARRNLSMRLSIRLNGAWAERPGLPIATQVERCRSKNDWSLSNGITSIRSYRSVWLAPGMMRSSFGSAAAA